jgi:DNA-directed RNA polymerase subunit F
MSKPEVIEKTPMNIVQVKDALERIHKTETELNFRAQKAEEYAQDFAKLSTKDAAALYDKLVALDIPRLRDVHLHKLIDLMPQSEKHVKLILSAMNVSPTADSAKKLADTITEFAPKK